jgi:hypothetical protein
MRVQPLRRSLLMDLIDAVSSGSVDDVQRLLAAGVAVDVEFPAPGGAPHPAYSALHAAAFRADPQILEILLSHCQDPDSARLGGATALAYVVHELGDLGSDPAIAMSRRVSLVKALSMLLRAGADPMSGATDQRPLELARMYGLDDVEALLVQGRTVR